MIYWSSQLWIWMNMVDAVPNRNFNLWFYHWKNFYNLFLMDTFLLTDTIKSLSLLFDSLHSWIISSTTGTCSFCEEWSSLKIIFGRITLMSRPAAQFGIRTITTMSLSRTDAEMSTHCPCAEFLGPTSISKDKKPCAQRLNLW